MTTKKPETAQPPGHTVKSFMQQYQMTTLELADKLRMSEEGLENLFTGRHRVTEELAGELSYIFSAGKDYWLALERDYRDELARERSGPLAWISAEGEIYNAGQDGMRKTAVRLFANRARTPTSAEIAITYLMKDEAWIYVQDTCILRHLSGEPITAEQIKAVKQLAAIHPNQKQDLLIKASQHEAHIRARRGGRITVSMFPEGDSGWPSGDVDGFVLRERRQ